MRAESSGYPRPYPINLWGKPPHGAMARQLTNFESGYVTVHTEVGESGKGITALIKQTGTTIGDTGRAYAATLFEAGAIYRIARSQGKPMAWTSWSHHDVRQSAARVPQWGSIEGQATTSEQYGVADRRPSQGCVKVRLSATVSNARARAETH
jgi:hypothetical protein